MSARWVEVLAALRWVLESWLRPGGVESHWEQRRRRGSAR